MTGQELRERRESLGLGQADFALALGFGGSDATRRIMVCQWETGTKPIPKTLKYRLAYLNLNKS